MNKADLGKQAVLAAGRLRSAHGIGTGEGLCPYDLAIKMGIKVSFIQAPTLEGMYSPAPKQAILLGSERPAGRRRYTCAHEIGHHVFNHGSKIDELDGENAFNNPEEYIAQRFAGALLMPALAIRSSLTKRNWKIETLTVDQAFQLSGEFGVGYETFLTHLSFTFLAHKDHFDELKKKTPKQIRRSIIGREMEEDVYLIDQFWNKKTIDLEVGDIVIVKDKVTVTNQNLELVEGFTDRYMATKQGCGQLKFSSDQRTIETRVSKRNQECLAKYRHLEEVEDE